MLALRIPEVARNLRTREAHGTTRDRTHGKTSMGEKRNHSEVERQESKPGVWSTGGKKPRS